MYPVLHSAISAIYWDRTLLETLGIKQHFFLELDISLVGDMRNDMFGLVEKHFSKRYAWEEVKRTQRAHDAGKVLLPQRTSKHAAHIMMILQDDLLKGPTCVTTLEAFKHGRPGTARTQGPGDLWHGPARKIMARKILARRGTENLGTEKYWHDMARKV